ncbi:MAG: thioredoxin family protein [Ilumatobacteraceae bacterium]
MSEFSDEHAARLLLDLLLWEKVYGLVVDVTLLYFDDCPNWRETDAHLRTLEREHPELHVARHIVDTPEEAERTRFRGSPSILIDGVDPFADADAPVGLSCRMYQTPDGPAGSPTLDQLREVFAGG